MTTDAALLAYEATFSSDLDFVISADFEAACTAYRDALNAQRAYCGDTGGALLAKIDALGNCQISCVQSHCK
ncbi:hypothetical protein FBALC1_01977 [Flavobacteriales bacterium ALC-1]|nr:hypothetical protein FBALC1_01977 [Flavobacteriales bacterium ALC-1]